MGEYTTAEYMKLKEQLEALRGATRNLLATWEESADYLDAKWLGMDKRIVELHDALLGVSSPAAALAHEEEPETPCSICGTYGHFTHNHPVAHEEEA